MNDNTVRLRNTATGMEFEVSEQFYEEFLKGHPDLEKVNIQQPANKKQEDK